MTKKKIDRGGIKNKLHREAGNNSQIPNILRIPEKVQHRRRHPATCKRPGNSGTDLPSDLA
jgi:hypothetical protein